VWLIVVKSQAIATQIFYECGYSTSLLSADAFVSGCRVRHDDLQFSKSAAIPVSTESETPFTTPADLY